MGQNGATRTAPDVFRIQEEHAGQGTVVLAVHGDADVHTANELRARLTDVIDQGPRSLVVDLSSVAFLDSMALGVLLGGMKRLRRQGGQLRLVVPARDIRRIFEITLLDRVFTLFPTRADALSEPASSRSTGAA
jgi:anti-sigma B factor antagonist